jgi:aminopeptidase N
VVTQFAATDCRRAFPCWDEPLLKATFDVILWVDPSLTALSNMNLLLEECMEKNGKMLKKCQFATTPRMSTYVMIPTLNG